MSMNVARQVSSQIPSVICPPLSLTEYLCTVCKGQPSQTLLNLGNGAPSQYMKDLICLMSTVGALQPLSAIRPDACEIAFTYDKTVEVGPATVNAQGQVVPTTKVLMRVCAPMGKALVIDKLRALPANLTAVESGTVLYKKTAVFGFSEGFCPPGEPGDGDDLGTFNNVEHVLLRPESGFDVYAQNSDPFSNALIHIFAKMWGAC